MKKFLKNSVKIAIEANGSPTAIIIILVKKPILLFLDKMIPDSEETK